MNFDLPRRLAAEALGTAFLVGAVVGSGIRPLDVPVFVTAELLGALVAVALVGWLLRPAAVASAPSG